MGKIYASLGGVAVLLVGLLAGPMCWAQAPAWQMAVGTTTSSISEATGTATDASGNVYVVGRFVGTISFGTKTLTSAGISDLFIAKWNPASMAFEWAVRAGGTGYDAAKAVAVSSAGIYVTGFTQSSLINFGPSTLSPVGGSDVFVAKISPAGSFVWAVQAGGTGTDEGYALAAEGANVYVGGHSTSSTMTFGALNVANAGSYRATDDGFVAKLTDAGTSASFTWAQAIGGIYNDQVNAVAVQGTRVYIAGSFIEKATFGTMSLTSNGVADTFVGKLLDAGGSSSFTWAQQAGGTGYDYAQALAVNGNRVYVGGCFDSRTASFGATTLTNNRSTGVNDAYVAQLTDAGSSSTYGWAQRMGGDNDDQVTALVATATGVCAAGYYYSGPATFGSLTLPNYVLAGGSSDVFVTQLTDNTTAGTFNWAQRAGGVSIDQAFGLALSGTNLYVAGCTTPQAIFAPLTIDAPVNVRLPFLASLGAITLATVTPGTVGWPVALAPNPASGTTTVVLPALPNTSTAVLTLFDVLGKVRLARTVALPTTAILPVHNLSAGVYILRIQAGSTIISRRLVVE